jgi:hypothetical protein
MSKRFTSMSVPGRDEDDEATWFVFDREAREDDPKRSVKCENMRHAQREAARMNAECERRYWRGILRLHGTAAGLKRYKVFVAGTDDDDNKGCIGLVVDDGDGWMVFGLDGGPITRPVQKCAKMDDALETLVVHVLMVAKTSYEEAK